MNKLYFEQLLDECRVRLEKGESLESILKAYPKEKNRLKPLLRAAMVVRSLPKTQHSNEALQSGKNRLLAEAYQMKLQNRFQENETKSGFLRYTGRWLKNIQNKFIEKENKKMKLASRLALYLVITVLVGGFFTTTYASASSLPGDALYSLKLGWEKTRIALSFNENTKTELKNNFNQERLSEVNALLSQGRIAKVKFYGTIEEKGDSAWLISGLTVKIDPETELEGTLEVGTLVKVEALTQEDGSLLAEEIEADSDQDDIINDMYDDDDDMDDDDDDMDDDDMYDDDDDGMYDDDDDMDDDDDDDMDDDDDDGMDDDDDDGMDDDDDDGMDDDDD
ncbi:MAG: DUF5666 domain-containing protein [Chloroflexota bacterium]|nr:DUF5666 domain-containing protein [Chloroflexota bacterium]